jgi:hypothetical protein
MSPQSLFIVIVCVCLVNGLISPVLPIIWSLYPVWLPELVRPNNEVVFYGASLILSTATLLLSAVPAAIAERAGLSQTGAMGVWLACAAGLLVLGVLPALG